jgi:hypothetical protein
VVIAVIAVGMMQVAIDEIIDMIAMRHRVMPASGAMAMIGGVSVAGMGLATARIVSRNFNRMLMDGTVCGSVVQMAIMKIIDMPVVLDAGMTTTCTMDMIVIGLTIRHSKTP